MQKDFGLSDKELKAAVKRHTEPREVKLPTYHEKLSKIEKKRQKALQPTNKKRKYKLVHWYLEEYLKPSEAMKIYEAHLDFKDLVEYTYQLVLGLVQLQSYIVEEDTPVERLIKPDPDGRYDVPEPLEKEFNEYAKKHPLESAKDIIKRRKKFQKHRRQRRRRLYSKSRMRIYDPLFAVNRVDAKQMYNELKRIGRENEIRVQKFKEMMESLVKDQSVGAEAMRMFDERTKIIMKQHEKRLNQFAEQAGLKANPVQYDFSDLFG